MFPHFCYPSIFMWRPITQEVIIRLQLSFKLLIYVFEIGRKRVF
jgi:hypothetical protein